MKINDIELFLETEEIIIHDALIKREIRINYEGVVKEVTHLQVLNWPDHSIPQNSLSIETVIAYINNNRDNYSSPILIHCRYNIFYIVLELVEQEL